MSLSKDELDRRLAEADRARMKLRRATLEWRQLGDTVLAQRSTRAARGLESSRSDRSDRGPARRR